MATTRRLRPGLSASAYLWMDEEHHDWVNQCQSSAPGTASMVLEHLDAPDDAEVVAVPLRNRPGGAIPLDRGTGPVTR